MNTPPNPGAPNQDSTRRPQRNKWEGLPREDWDHARTLYAQGKSQQEIAHTLGVTRATVQKHIDQENWQRDRQQVLERDRAHVEAMRESTQREQRKWAERREQEADAAGVTAAFARSQVVEALRRNDHNMTRAAVIAYGVFIDKAQLLSGAATERTDLNVREGLDAELERLAVSLAATDASPEVSHASRMHTQEVGNGQG